MPIVQDTTRLGRAVDLTDEINIVPNSWGIINQLGLFVNEPKSLKYVQIPRKTELEIVAIDRNWDERNSAQKSPDRDFLALAIPHFPMDDAVTPNDVDGLIDFDQILASGNTLEAIPRVMQRKMVALRKTLANTLEVARAQIIRDGSVYAPSGTVVTNYYTEFGVTRDVIPLGLNSTTVDPLAAVNDVVGVMQDDILDGSVVTEFIALCSSEFFNALVTNPFVVESYRYYSQSQGPQILNQRLGSAYGLDARYRSFVYGGITFIEVRGSIAGIPYVTAGQAYVFPLGSDLFRTYYAPANRLSTVNTLAEMVYLFQYVNNKDDIIELMSESNFLNALLRPQAVKTLTIA